MNTLCTYCKHEDNCTLTGAKETINDCSEYRANIVFTDFTANTNNSEGTLHKTSAGLCSTCDFANNCSYNEFGKVVFSCEHYQ